MKKRSTSAGRERDPRVSLEKVPVATSRNQLFSTSLSLLKNSPYTQPQDRQKTPTPSNLSTTLPAVNNVRRSKTPPPKSRPVSSGAAFPDKSAVPNRRITTTLPPATASHSRPTTAHLPPTSLASTLPTNGIPSKSFKSKALFKDKDRDSHRDRDQYKDEEHSEYQIDDPRKGLTVIKPQEQLQLSEEQLNEEVQIVLTAADPQVRDSVVIFSLMERQYKPSPSVDQSVCVFDLEGYHLHIDTEEGKKQISINQEEKRKQDMHNSTFTNAAHLYGSGDFDDESGPVLRNPFNFSDRAVQTISRPPRDRSTMTEPAARGTFGATVTQWAIYDAYEEERNAQQGGSATTGSVASAAITSVASNPVVSTSKPVAEGHKRSDEPRNFIPVEHTLRGNKTSTTTLLDSSSFFAKLQIMERMVVQNATMGITMDYKYWDDPADQYQEEGSLLPLWKFCPSIALGKTVTGICWNARYPDLFAVSHGSYDLVKMTAALLPLPELPDAPDLNENKLPFSAGVICCYSLKNVAHPEYLFVTESGVMCIDFHPQHPSLMAAGLYDGRVCVYSLTQPASKNPLFISSVRQKKHTEPVWMVRWQEDDLSKNLNFYSLSSDGRLTSWTLVKNEMLHNDILEMKVTRKPSPATASPSPPSQTQTQTQSSSQTQTDSMPDDADYDTSLYGLAGGCCLDFLHGDHLFIVGTEEGALHKCSKAYSGRYLATYEGHTMAILSVEWNKFHPRVFLTCGADWSVKIWDHTKTDPIFALEFKIPICDAKWAPFSSTIFAVATADGKISVYDLARNKRDPLCCQLVTKSVPTHIAFNPIHPILLVADSQGRVHSLKMSPNLRLHQPNNENKDAINASGNGNGSGNGGLQNSQSQSSSALLRTASKRDKSGPPNGDPNARRRNDNTLEEINKLEQALMGDLKKKHQ